MQFAGLLSESIFPPVIILKGLQNLGEPQGIDEIKVWLGQALASGAHPHRDELLDSYLLNIMANEKPPRRVVFCLVERT